MSSSTVDEIARLAGVSKSTVSRVINNSSRVDPALAQSVLDTMNRIGYRPSSRRPGPKPVSRRGVRTGNLLLLFVGHRIAAGHQWPGSPELIRGIENAVEEMGMKLMLAGIDADAPLPAALNPREIDAVILLGKPNALTPQAAAELPALPAIALVRSFDSLRAPIDESTYDNSLVGPMAARYLLSRGHRNVGFFNSNPAYPPFAARQRDFTTAATIAGATVTPLLGDDPAPELGPSIRTTRAIVDRMLALPNKPTALFVTADSQLPSLYHVLEDLDLRPGRDLDIISCDNSRQHLDQIQPRPATIDINLELLGHRAVHQLLWRLANPNIKNPMKLVVEPVLISPAE